MLCMTFCLYRLECTVLPSVIGCMTMKPSPNQPFVNIWYILPINSGVFFTKGICARNIFKSWKMVPKANLENFVKIWSPEEEIWGFKDVRRCRFYFMDVNHSSSKRATNDSHKEHVHTLTLILMALVRPKVNSNGIKSIFRYFCMILFLH